MQTMMSCIIIWKNCLIQYLDDPDDFDFVSEEFESGLEQYQDEIGKNEMEL